LKSSRRDQAEGTRDRFAAALLETVGALTGSRSTKAKARLTRARGVSRRIKGAFKDSVGSR